MAKPRTILAVRKLVAGQRLPTEREILELAAMTSYIFDLPDAAGLRKRLQHEAEVYRDWLRYQQDQKDEAHQASLGKDARGHDRVAYGVGAQRFLPDPETLTFLLAFLFTCPQILSRPTGFDWVLQDLEKLLVARRIDPESDRMFVKVMNKARTKSRVGAPKDNALEYFRYATINELMNPSMVIPGVTVKMNKTKAVGIVAEIESRLFGGDAGVRSIWKSYKRVDQFFRQLLERAQDESLLSPPLIDRPDSEPQERIKRTKHRVMQSKHRKRVRRK